MKFIIKWCECHNPNNWGDNWEEGKKSILDSYPFEKYDIADDGWIDGICRDVFEAKSVEDAKKYVDDTYECEVYDVYDGMGNRLFSEGD